MEKVFFNYFDELFPYEDINWNHPYDYDDETGEESEDGNRIEYYLGDFDEGDDICFRYYTCDYFNEDSYAQTICPTLNVESRYENLLDGYFGDLWKEPFRLWFQKNFELPVKTVDL